MAPISPPAWMQAGSYAARVDRLVIAGLLGYPGFAVDEATPLRPRQGVRPSYQNQQFKVRAAGTPNMTVIVSAGYCYIENHDLAGYGAYVCVNDADYTVTVPAAGGAGQYRKDTIVASVYDAETAGAASEFRIELIQGPYAASAGATTRGSLPPNAQILADLAIAPSQTSVAAGNITDVRQFAVGAGGIVPINSANDMDHPAPGQVRYRMDTDTFVYGKSDGTTKVLLDSSGASTIGKTIFKYKAANLGRTTATLSDDPDLTATVEANAVYDVESLLFFYTTDETNADINVDWTVPGSAGGRWAGYGQGTADLSGVSTPNANSGLMRTVSSAIDAARAYGALSDTNNPLSVYTRHLLTTVSSGTFALSWARTGGAGTVTLLAGSFLSMTRRA